MVASIIAFMTGGLVMSLLILVESAFVVLLALLVSFSISDDPPNWLILVSVGIPCIISFLRILTTWVDVFIEIHQLL